MGWLKDSPVCLVSMDKWMPCYPLDLHVVIVAGLRVVGIEILIPESEVGIDHNWVAGFGLSEVGFVRNSEFRF